jgi:hypothetical protein
VNYNSLSKNKNKSNWKGRGLERTNSRQCNRVEVNSPPLIGDNSEIDLDEYEDSIEVQNIFARLQSNDESNFYKDSLKITKKMVNNKSKEQQIDEFKEKLEQILKEVYTFYYSGGKNKKTNGEIINKTIKEVINKRIIESKEY